MATEDHASASVTKDGWVIPASVTKRAREGMIVIYGYLFYLAAGALVPPLAAELGGNADLAWIWVRHLWLMFVLALVLRKSLRVLREALAARRAARQLGW